jgi:hypothetical protein
MLWTVNEGRNDTQLAAVFAEYGLLARITAWAEGID